MAGNHHSWIGGYPDIAEPRHADLPVARRTIPRGFGIGRCPSIARFNSTSSASLSSRRRLWHSSSSDNSVSRQLVRKLLASRQINDLRPAEVRDIALRAATALSFLQGLEAILIRIPVAWRAREDRHLIPFSVLVHGAPKPSSVRPGGTWDKAMA